MKNKQATGGAKRNRLRRGTTFLPFPAFTTFILPTETQRCDSCFDFGRLFCVAFGTIKWPNRGNRCRLATLALAFGSLKWWDECKHVRSKGNCLQVNEKRPVFFNLLLEEMCSERRRRESLDPDYSLVYHNSVPQWHKRLMSTEWIIDTLLKKNVSALIASCIENINLF